MTAAMTPKERFRRGFELALTLAYAIAFLAMISGFFEALLLAAVFSGIVHPLYGRLQGVLGGRNTLARLAHRTDRWAYPLAFAALFILA